MTDLSNLPMMDGTETTSSYLMIGKIGNIALGVKPERIINGSAAGVPGHLWFGLRFRAAPHLVEVSPGGVVKLSDHKQFGKPADALPGVTWENSSHIRASTTIGVLIKGGGSEDAAAAIQFIDEFDYAGLSEKLLAFLTKQVGAENMILTQEQITAWFTATYRTILGKVREAAEKAAGVQTAMKSTAGSFMVMADLLKKVHDNGGEKINPKDLH